jgi:hypothetical protein
MDLKLVSNTPPSHRALIGDLAEFDICQSIADIGVVAHAPVLPKVTSLNWSGTAVSANRGAEPLRILLYGCMVADALLSKLSCRFVSQLFYVEAQHVEQAQGILPG